MERSLRDRFQIIGLSHYKILGCFCRNYIFFYSSQFFIGHSITYNFLTTQAPCEEHCSYHTSNNYDEKYTGKPSFHSFMIIINFGSDLFSFICHDSFIVHCIFILIIFLLSIYSNNPAHFVFIHRNHILLTLRSRINLSITHLILCIK